MLLSAPESAVVKVRRGGRRDGDMYLSGLVSTPVLPEN